MSENITPETDAAKKDLQAGKEHFRQATESLRHAAEVKASELRDYAGTRATEFRTAAEAKAEELRARARTLGEDTEAYVRANPLRAVATAAGIGFVLGMIFRR